MNDPLDSPPADHGSDRYDYVELIDAPGNPLGPWWDKLIDAPCPDCRANVFARYVGGKLREPSSWSIEIAHDPTCPMVASLP